MNCFCVKVLKLVLKVHVLYMEWNMPSFYLVSSLLCLQSYPPVSIGEVMIRNCELSMT